MRIKWFSMVRVTGLLLVLLYHFFKNYFLGDFSVLMSFSPFQVF